MALILKKIYKSYFFLTVDSVDHDYVENWTHSPLFVVSFIAGYLFIVKKLGPKFMENRKPYNIRKLLIVYNVIQILINLKLTYEAFLTIQASPYTLCVQSPLRDLVYSTRQQYFALKLLDSMETVFFVLRKSDRQVSFLHVYHHGIMIFTGWVGAKYDLGDTIMLIGVLNCFIHVIMFVYYLLTSIDSAWKKSVFLKKTLTTLQLIQFLSLILIYTFESIIPDCKTFPSVIAFLFIIQNMFMFCLFSEFYYKTYWKEDKNRKMS
ncbi:unnamed protein product [Psylliodes chrysocephalus]|uniref:Elongation of very long chain fatty acids protein n=1 Tax=Psylliodes chrysocephalus TaxID=3402493 RepID=A0A9P0CKI2_9CUCU|nr:unnamed protein product [Psylliodes chrysocephala]